jgi:hypothetical protein
MATPGVRMARCPPDAFVSVLLDITIYLLFPFVCYVYLKTSFFFGGGGVELVAWVGQWEELID